MKKLTMTIKLAVVGKNIAYSKSPFIHTEFAKALGLQVDYTLQDVGGGSFEAKIAMLQSAGFKGCNITVPYKEAAFALADEQSERAILAGAANTFVFEADNTIFADNTDGIGFIRDVTQNKEFSLQEKRILICGAGGAVRGILGALLTCQLQGITLANRTLGKGQALSELFTAPDFAIKACSYADLAHQSFDVVIDGTSLKNEMLPLPASLSLNGEALVYDLKYSPNEATAIMQWARTKGAKHIYDGIGMLVEQAAESFHIWTGKVPQTKPVILQLTERRAT